MGRQRTGLGRGRHGHDSPGRQMTEQPGVAPGRLHPTVPERDGGQPQAGAWGEHHPRESHECQVAERHLVRARVAQLLQQHLRLSHASTLVPWLPVCGIVGYVGHRSALDVVIGGLRRLEYRGYDSAGVAVLDGNGALAVERKAGRLGNLEEQLDAVGRDAFAGSAGMGHTRWATHGPPVDRNSRPHRDASGKVAVVHNGIIENFAALRAELEAAGVDLASDTDTETAAHLIALAYAEGPTAGDFPASVRAVCRRLEGAFTLVVAHADHPDTNIAARRSSPLVVGVGEGEHFVASDVAAFIEHTREAVELGQDQVVEITRDDYQVTDFNGEPAQGKPFTVNWDLS